MNLEVTNGSVGPRDQHPPAPPEVGPVSAEPKEEPQKGRRPRDIAIFGARSTGKTCYLACLYGRRASPHSTVQSANEESLSHLEIAWKCLCEGERPGGTAMVPPTELRFDLLANKRRWAVRTHDYSGRLTENRGRDAVFPLILVGREAEDEFGFKKSDLPAQTAAVCFYRHDEDDLDKFAGSFCEFVEWMFKQSRR